MNGDSRFVSKSPTGIRGLDEITHGGFPAGRNTLLCGGPGSGKTVLAMKYLLTGALQYDEPGLCLTFEESTQELVDNLRSLGSDAQELISRNALAIDHVQLGERELESGEYDLSGLFIRIDEGINAIGANRVVLDTIEALFSNLPNEAIVRSELQRLFRWLKDRGVTTVITAESGENTLTRHGLEEYVADCVIRLDHRVENEISTRRLRIVKYRGSAHGTNEYPFLLDESGPTVMPITSVGLTHTASCERLSSGNAGLDDMLGGKGFFRSSSILVSGSAGTGKSSFAMQFATGACKRGEHVLYFAFEESPSQIARNMRSIGIDVQACEDKLNIIAARPTSTGLESHLARIHRDIEEFRPSVVIFDPVTNLVSAGNARSAKSMITRLIDYLKLQTITALFTELAPGPPQTEVSIGISSLMDTWIALAFAAGPQRSRPETVLERRRTVQVLKSRGMSHAKAIRSFEFCSAGINILGTATGAEERNDTVMARKLRHEKKRR